MPCAGVVFGPLFTGGPAVVHASKSNTDTVRWFEWGTNYNLNSSTGIIYHGSSASNFNISITGLSSNTTYYYRAMARNAQGTVQGSLLSFTTSYSNNTNTNTTTGSSLAPSVATLLATELTGTTAKLNGLVFTSSSQSSSSWFEWGTNTNLSNKTQTFSVGALPSIKHSDFITGLVSGQAYYYRVVAENSYGREYGVIIRFVAEVARVQDNTVVINTQARNTTTYINRVTTVQVQAPVTLTIDGGSDSLSSGESRGYRVTWRNDSNRNLRNVALRISFPRSMNFESTNIGAYSAADNTVVVDVKFLNAGETGEAFVSAIADKNLKSGELVVVTANMVYTDTDGTQSDAVAYVVHHGITSQNVLGANLFGSGAFLPSTILEWSILFILLLLLILAGNHLYGRFSETRE